MDQIRDKIIEIISGLVEGTDVHKHFKTEELLEPLGIDSFSFVRLVVLLEDEFKINFEDDKLILNEFKTLTILEKYIIDRKNITR